MLKQSARLYVAERPIKVSKAALMASAGITIRDYSAQKIPLTWAALEDNAEGTAEFRVRKARWAISTLKSQGKPVTRYSVIKLAGLRRDVQFLMKLLEEVG